MNPLRILLAAVICLALAGTALAATSAPKAGKYKGKTAQTDSRTGKKFAVTFKIAQGKISKVSTYTRDKCPDGTFLRVRQNAFTSATLDAKGRFTLQAGTTEQPAVMKGKVSGSKASGTITDRTNDPGTSTTPPSGICKASTTWTAKLVK
jgi:opacity protein-like surface antigen